MLYLMAFSLPLGRGDHVLPMGCRFLQIDLNCSILEEFIMTIRTSLKDECSRVFGWVFQVLGDCPPFPGGNALKPRLTILHLTIFVNVSIYFTRMIDHLYDHAAIRDLLSGSGGETSCHLNTWYWPGYIDAKLHGRETLSRAWQQQAQTSQQISYRQLRISSSPFA